MGKASKASISRVRKVLDAHEGHDATPLESIVNFGPVTLPELESLGYATLGDLREAGWENVCRRWAECFPDRLNANAFLGVIAALDGVVWTQAKLSHRAEAQRFVRRLRRELGMPEPASKSRRLRYG